MIGLRVFVLDNGDIVEVDFSYRILDSDQLEIGEYDAWLWADRNNMSALIFKLNDIEFERFESEVIADPHTWEYDYDYD